MVDVTEGSDKGVLCQFLGIHHVRYLADDHGEHSLSIATDHCVLPLAPSSPDGFHNLLFCQLSHFYLLYDKVCEISRTFTNFFS